MNKQSLMEILQESAGVPVTNERGEFVPQPKAVARFLGITPQTIWSWNDPISRQVLTSIAGDYVRIGKRVPTKIVECLRAMK